MANIQLLQPCCITTGVTAGRGHGDSDKSQYQCRERLSKYSNGGQGGWLVTSEKARGKDTAKRRNNGEKRKFFVLYFCC